MLAGKEYMLERLVNNLRKPSNRDETKLISPKTLLYAGLLTRADMYSDKEPDYIAIPCASAIGGEVFIQHTDESQFRSTIGRILNSTDETLIAALLEMGKQIITNPEGKKQSFANYVFEKIGIQLNHESVFWDQAARAASNSHPDVLTALTKSSDFINGSNDFELLKQTRAVAAATTCIKLQLIPAWQELIQHIDPNILQQHLGLKSAQEYIRNSIPFSHGELATTEYMEALYLLTTNQDVHQDLRSQGVVALISTSISFITNLEFNLTQGRLTSEKALSKVQEQAPRAVYLHIILQIPALFENYTRDIRDINEFVKDILYDNLATRIFKKDVADIFLKSMEEQYISKGGDRVSLNNLIARMVAEVCGMPMEKIADKLAVDPENSLIAQRWLETHKLQIEPHIFRQLSQLFNSITAEKMGKQ